MSREPNGPVFRSQTIPLFVARLRDLRVDLEPLIRAFHLPPDVMALREVEVPLSVVHELPMEAERLTGDPLFGFHVATWLPRGAYGLLEFIVRSARDVREAATRLVRYNGMLNDLATLSFHETETEGVMKHAIAGQPACVGRHANELVLALMVRVLRESIAGDGWSPCRVAFAHERTGELERSEVGAYFGTDRIEFERGHNEVAARRADLTLPLQSADSALLSVLDEQAMRLLTSKPYGADELGVRLRETIRVSLRDGLPSLDVIATDLGTSARSLQRRLESEGTSFLAVVDTTRRELACMYVEAGALRDVEIAFLLGYAERRAFVRAFKRWTGLTPAAYRQGAAERSERG